MTSLSKAMILDIAISVQQVASTLNQMRSPRSSHNKALLDLDCVCRTLVQVARTSEELFVHSDHITAVEEHIRYIEEGTRQFVAEIGQVRGNAWGESGRANTKNSNAGFGAQHDVFAVDIRVEVLDSISHWAQVVCSAINKALSATRFLVAPAEYVTQYGTDLVVSRSSSKDRYILGADCSYEDQQTTLSTSSDGGLVIFEHIELKSGGSHFYDPTLFSRQPDSAQAFFTVGRVFMMLWDTQELGDHNQEVIDDDSTSIKDDRRRMTASEGLFTGPFTGSTTVRRFLVVKEGSRSCYCLPVSTFGLRGCSHQPDQENYGIMFTGHQAPTTLPGEVGTQQPPLRIRNQQLQRPWIPVKMAVPSIEPWELPSRDLPPESRVDYRRLCEVEHNVRCKNIGVLDGESLTKLPHFAQFWWSRDSLTYDADAMDLD